MSCVFVCFVITYNQIDNERSDVNYDESNFFLVMSVIVLFVILRNSLRIIFGIIFLSDEDADAEYEVYMRCILY